MHLRLCICMNRGLHKKTALVFVMAKLEQASAHLYPALVQVLSLDAVYGSLIVSSELQQQCYAVQVIVIGGALMCSAHEVHDDTD